MGDPSRLNLHDYFNCVCLFGRTSMKKMKFVPVFCFIQKIFTKGREIEYRKHVIESAERWVLCRRIGGTTRKVHRTPDIKEKKT